MIIVSQDKDLILNFENIVDIHIDNEDTNRKIYALGRIQVQYMLGEYKTEERAKEILQEIINTYKHGIIRVKIENCKWVEENQIYEMPDE